MSWGTGVMLSSHCGYMLLSAPLLLPSPPVLGASPAPKGCTATPPASPAPGVTALAGCWVSLAPLQAGQQEQAELLPTGSPRCVPAACSVTGELGFSPNKEVFAKG